MSGRPQAEVRPSNPLHERLGFLGKKILPRLLNPERRWYLKAGLSIPHFLARLQEFELPYVVLGGAGGRPGQDLEILVADEHIPDLQPLLSDWPAGPPCNVYAATGLPGFTYRFWPAPGEPIGDMAAFPGDMAVFPPYITARILNRAILGADGFRQPAPEDEFLAWVYRAIYLEGARSGLPSETDPTPACVSDRALRDRAQLLAMLAGEFGIALPQPLTLEGLDEMLSRSGWRPPRDVLERLSVCHPWIARKFFPAGLDRRGEEPGMAVFFIRQRAAEAGLGDRIAALIERTGFEILSTVELKGERFDEAARTVRGGNWGPGDFPVCGGGPVTALVALDLIPQRVSDSTQRYYPALDNARLLYTKLCVRTTINDELPLPLRYNALHSTDNSLDAWHVIERLVPEQEAILRETVQQRRAAFATSEEIVTDLTSMGDRAKIELIRYGDGLAVKKTFRHHALRFLRRELEFIDRFSSERPEVTPVLKRGPNYFITPFHENVYTYIRFLGSHLPRLLPLDRTRQLADFVRHVLDRGYDPVDVMPYCNVLIDRAGEMRLVDFEFVHCLKEPAASPERSFCIAGVPEGFEGDLPVLAPHFRNPYPTHWYPFTGLSAVSLFHDPRWLQALKRPVNYSSYIGMRALRASIRSERIGALALKQWLRPRLVRLLRAVLQASFRPDRSGALGRIRQWRQRLAR